MQVVAEIDTVHECEESGLFPIPDSDCTRYRNCVEVHTELILNSTENCTFLSDRERVGQFPVLLPARPAVQPRQPGRARPLRLGGEGGLPQAWYCSLHCIQQVLLRQTWPKP